MVSGTLYMLILHYRFFPNALSQCIVLRLCLFFKITRLFYIPNYRAFGVLMWEIFTSGFIPYPGLQNNDVMTFVRKGGRLEIPAICPQSMYVLHRPLRDSISGNFFHYSEFRLLLICKYESNKF